MIIDVIDENGKLQNDKFKSITISINKENLIVNAKLNEHDKEKVIDFENMDCDNDVCTNKFHINHGFPIYGSLPNEHRNYCSFDCLQKSGDHWRSSIVKVIYENVGCDNDGCTNKFNINIGYPRYGEGIYSNKHYCSLNCMIKNKHKDIPNTVNYYGRGYKRKIIN